MAVGDFWPPTRVAGVLLSNWRRPNDLNGNSPGQWGWSPSTASLAPTHSRPRARWRRPVWRQARLLAANTCRCQGLRAPDHHVCRLRNRHRPPSAQPNPSARHAPAPTCCPARPARRRPNSTAAIQLSPARLGGQQSESGADMNLHVFIGSARQVAGRPAEPSRSSRQRAPRCKHLT